MLTKLNSSRRSIWCLAWDKFGHVKRLTDSTLRPTSLNYVYAIKFKGPKNNVTALEFSHRAKYIVFGLFLAILMVQRVAQRVAWEPTMVYSSVLYAAEFNINGVLH